MSRLGTMLVELGWMSSLELSKAVEHQRQTGGRLGTSILELELLGEELLMKALSHRHALPAASVRDLDGIPPEIHGQVAPQLAIRHQAIPFRILGDELQVAVLDLQDPHVAEDVAYATGMNPRFFLTNELRMVAALDRYYGQPVPSRFKALVERLEATSPATKGADRSTQDVDRDVDAKVQMAYDSIRPELSTAYTEEPSRTDRPVRTLEELEAALQGATHDVEQVEALLAEDLASRVGNAAVFLVRREQVVGRCGRGESVDHDRLLQFQLSLEKPSIFLNLRHGGMFHSAPLAPMPEHERLSAIWQAPAESDFLVLPVRLDERLVLVLMAWTPRPTASSTIGRQVQAAQLGSEALGRCLARALNRDQRAS